MLRRPPIIIRPREVQDGELREMLSAASAAGDTADFFSRFAYYHPGKPFETLESGEALLSKCKQLAPDAYNKLHKGTPFYWLAQAAFLVHDYETATFYIDAAVSEDLRKNVSDTSSPALLFYLLNDIDERQASLELVKLVRARIEKAIKDYNRRPDLNSAPLASPEIQKYFLVPSIVPGKEYLRTLVTAFISFFLEWDHKSGLIEIRVEQGTAEPFFTHLFKGCVLFESLLKANTKNTPTAKLLGSILGELKDDLGFAAKPNMTIGNFDFQTIVNSLSTDDNTVYTAIERTGRIRNTTGHNLGWQVLLNRSAYDGLAAYVATSCLHSIACLYR